MYYVFYKVGSRPWLVNGGPFTTKDGALSAITNLRQNNPEKRARYAACFVEPDLFEVL